MNDDIIDCDETNLSEISISDSEKAQQNISQSNSIDLVQSEPTKLSKNISLAP